MRFDNTVEAIWRMTELRRIAGAHVVDHRQLSPEELKAAITKAKPQYLDQATVRKNLEFALYQEPRTDFRVLSRLILIDVLLDQYDFELPVSQTEERVIRSDLDLVLIPVLTNRKWDVFVFLIEKKLSPQSQC